MVKVGEKGMSVMIPPSEHQQMYTLPSLVLEVAVQLYDLHKQSWVHICS